MKTINIKGKEYVPVNERIIAFRKEHPDWSIQTSIYELKDNFVLMQTLVSDQEGKVKATAFAYEREDSSFINKTSFIENCETSAVGRALGFLGIGVDTSIASYEEVATAVRNQPKPSKERTISDKEVIILREYLEAAGKSEKEIIDSYPIDSLSQLSERLYKKLINRLKILANEK